MKLFYSHWQIMQLLQYVCFVCNNLKKNVDDGILVWGSELWTMLDIILKVLFGYPLHKLVNIITKHKQIQLTTTTRMQTKFSVLCQTNAKTTFSYIDVNIKFRCCFFFFSLSSYFSRVFNKEPCALPSAINMVSSSPLSQTI